MQRNQVLFGARHIIPLLMALLMISSYVLTPTVSTASSTQRDQEPQPIVQVPVFSIDQSRVHGRIVGGTNAAQNEFPWQALLYITFPDGTGMCGGSLVMRQYILTAAHCVTNDAGTPVAARSIRVYLGMHDRRYLTARSQTRTGSQLFVHASYDPESYDYDIAVIKLNSPVTLNNYVKTIRVARSNETRLFNAGNDVTVSGWGTTSFGGNTPNILRKTTVDIVARTTCNRSNSYAGAITSRMLCASRTGKDSCQGDSGGPLFLRDGSVFKQVGVVSFGIGCANSMYPGVYTHLGVLRGWVASKVPALP